MATWEDGPEYAPVTRPDHFAEAAAAPLASVDAPEPAPPAPIDRPGFDQPAGPVVDLETLVPPLADPRDPAVPFDVVSSTLTEATSAWSAAHWSQTTGPAHPTTPPALPDPRATTAPWPPLEQYPAPIPAAAGPAPSAFPAPGTTQWFAPPPPLPAPPAPVSVGAAAVAQALTPGLIICLAVGGIVWLLAPIAFGIAFALTARMQAGRSLTRALFGAAVGLLTFILLFGILLGDGVFGDWWGLLARWAQALSWIMLVVGAVVVYRDLRSRGGAPARSNWG